MNAKFYAATQVMDEARHVETYKRLLHEKFELAYPITPALKTLLEQTLTDRRWDMTYLGMQVLIEGLALAAFQRIRDKAQNTLAARGQRLCHAGRGAPRRLRPPGAARLLSAAHRRRARRARGVRRRGAATSCATASTRRRCGSGSACRSRNARATSTATPSSMKLVPQPAVQPHRADRQGHRPVGPAGAEGVRRRWA